MCVILSLGIGCTSAWELLLFIVHCLNVTETKCSLAPTDARGRDYGVQTWFAKWYVQRRWCQVPGQDDTTQGQQLKLAICVVWTLYAVHQSHTFETCRFPVYVPLLVQACWLTLKLEEANCKCAMLRPRTIIILSLMQKLVSEKLHSGMWGKLVSSQHYFQKNFVVGSLLV